jgi:hypothetical protein
VPSLEIFFRDCIAGLKRIAAATRGDASLDDVKNEAWAMALDLTAKGTPLDLALPADQDSMLGKLYGKLVRPLRTCIGFALRLDKDWDQEDGEIGPRLGETLEAPETSDPLKAAALREEPTLLELTRRHSYSQATAYAICLTRWPDKASLAIYLAIALQTLNNRIAFWTAWIEYQPSLFDGIDFIDLDFTPTEGSALAPRIVVSLDGEQQAWSF